MGKYFKSGSLVAMAATAILMSSCAKDFELYDPVKDATAKYEKSWKDTFGNIDPNQDWNMATQKTVNIAVDGTKTVQILTGNPYLNEGKLAGEFVVTTQLSTNVDLTKGQNIIYAVQRNEDGTKDVRTTYISEDGTFNVNFASSASNAPTRAITRSGDRSCTEFAEVYRGTPYTTGLYYYSDQWNTYSCLWNDAPKNNYNNWGDKYYYVGDNAYGTTTVDVSIIDAIKEIVPENKKTSYYNTIIKDVDLVVKEAGPVTLTLANATTSNNAAIGYYIYTDKKVDNTDMACPDWLTGEWLQENGYDAGHKSYTVETRTGITDKQKLADKFVIIPNVKDNNVTPTENKAPGSAENNWNYNITTSYNCKTITLLYKDPTTGEVSETFPAGTKISFFVVPNANCNGSNYIDARRTVFSFADMNVDAHRTNVDYIYYNGFNADTYSSSHAATFKVQDKIVIGFEDANKYSSDDFDYNDCIFLLDGNFDEEIIPDPIPEEKPEENSWIIACEDLGSTDDYDFNDIVFKVSHVAGQNVATVTPLAAGGIYESHILFNNVALGETHQMLGAKATEGNYPMINTSSITATGTSQTVTVPTDFSLANSMGGFGITVKTNDNINAVIITAPDAGEAPQMFCVPGTWAWPTERTKIQEAYPNFADWNGNSNNIEWYNNPTAGKVLGGN